MPAIQKSVRPYSYIAPPGDHIMPKTGNFTFYAYEYDGDGELGWYPLIDILRPGDWHLLSIIYKKGLVDLHELHTSIPSFLQFCCSPNLSKDLSALMFDYHVIEKSNLSHYYNDYNKDRLIKLSRQALDNADDLRNCLECMLYPGEYCHEMYQ